MDDGVDDDVAPLDVAERTHLRTKENQYLIRPPESSDVVGSGEMIIPGEGSFHEIADILDASVINQSGLAVDGSEQPCASPSFMDDVGNMVQELTVRNYNCSNLAVVGTSNNRDRMQVKLGQWQHLFQLGGASGSGSLRSNALHRDNGQGSFEDLRYSTSSPVSVTQKTSSGDCNEVVEEAANAEITALGGNMVAHGSIRTKILSKSGFSEFFVKNRLKGKGIIFRESPDEGVKLVLKDGNAGQAATGTIANPTTSQNLGVKTAIPCSFVVSEPMPAGSDRDGVLLRHWLNMRQHIMNKVECLHIFKQIVDLVNRSHSQGVPLYDLRPSRFKLLQSNQVKFIGSSAQRDMLTVSRDAPSTENHVIRRRPAEQGMLPSLGAFAKKQKISENTNSVRQWPLFATKYGFTFETVSDRDIGLPSTHASIPELTGHNPNSEYRNQVKNGNQRNTAQQPMSFVNDRLEEKWYESPEELSEGICTASSNIYSLGVLLFELLVHFDSEREHATAMADLRHRILPPHFLSRYPKEAGFCLWLLHPEPSSRPTVREVLQSEVINGLQEVCEEELSSTIDQDDVESELLLHFLASLKEHKQKHASKLADDIRCIESDIGEVERRTCSKISLASQLLHVSETNEMRLKNIIRQLESAYFSLRSQIQLPKTDAAINHKARDVLTSRENCCFAMGGFEKENLTDSLGSFFDGLCKYARYSKFEVRGLMRTGEFNNSANVICSLSFDRDLDYFATAVVSKKIKIFEFSSLLNDSVDIHYPAVEMSNESKLSCVCWNNYIKNYLVSTDYDGVVKLWDANTGQRVFQYTEHERRAWSVDFSQMYPTKLASGSDDCAVKLWSINERNSLATIKNIANVCCVQFSSHSTHLLAFGSADYRTYCYDLRNVRVPWCILAGHGKTVSHVKFLDPGTLVTASTDNSLKLWDLNKVSASGVSTNACSLTLTGHVNEKNFVGLSVADGYIACGSETNEVYAYYRSLPMPITSHKFGSIDPISGKETDDDNGQFVSSVCWRGKSDTAIAANSTGSIKVLQMV